MSGKLYHSFIIHQNVFFGIYNWYCTNGYIISFGRFLIGSF